ncbi:hypothetical protein [Nocardia nova]
MSRYRVIAPLVIANDHERRANHHYAGSVIQWLSDEQRRHLLDMGMVEELPDATPPGVVGPDEDEDEPVTVQQGTDNPAAVQVSETPNAEQVSPTTEQVTPITEQTEAPRPPQIANKETWVNWAVEAKGLSREQAEAMTLVDLKAL